MASAGIIICIANDKEGKIEPVQDAVFKLDNKYGRDVSVPLSIYNGDMDDLRDRIIRSVNDCFDIAGEE